MGILALIPTVAFAQSGNTTTTRTCSAIEDTYARVDCEIGMPAFIPPDVAPPATWEDSKLVESTPGLFVPDGTPWRGFAKGHCTEYVASRRKIVFRGDARRWPENAVKAGYSLSSDPIVGAIVVTTESRYGHVAYVESFTDTTITVSEMNYVGRGIVSTRTLHRDDRRIRTFIL